MKTLLVTLAVLAFALPAYSATLTWDRNSETDMQDYQVWACFVPSCVIVKSPSTLQPVTIPQTATGIKPSTQFDVTGKEGAVAVSARDNSLNESGLSVQVPFDAKAPAIPANPSLR